jgi:lipoic acid synthetase
MLGMGETEAEIESALEALLSSGVRILTLGQYLRPGRDSWPVARYLDPGEFDSLRARALEMGFSAVASGPLVRSSFDAERIFAESSGLPAGPGAGGAS